ncbi:MAG TPA: endonuclease/exonuclease/phosphatase family protein [Pyrinomonadaceae bacterium]|nr:endonuclease/exonuclease/phosphatase family protein [Pyrinomonadaceae bacterium]
MATTETTNAPPETPTESPVELGSFTAPPELHVPQHDTRRCVIATFNIRYAVGRFLISGGLLRKAGLYYNRPRPPVVAGHIAATATAFTQGRLMPRADIIALQEADRGTVRAGGHHVARELARALAMNYAHAAMHIPRGEQPKDRQWYLDFEERIQLDDPGDTGVAVLSRLPLSAARRVDLPWTECAWRPRLALACSAHTGKRPLHIFNTHIDPHANVAEQLAQHEAILAECERQRGAPTVLLGDFNTLFPRSRAATRALLEARGFTTPMPTATATWRAGLIRLHADWLFVRDVRVVRWGVARPLNVSDHWPVWAELELPAASGVA